MEEIDLKELFTYFWAKKLYIILIAACALVVGVIYSFNIQKPMYKSYTTILLTKLKILILISSFFSVITFFCSRILFSILHCN